MFKMKYLKTLALSLAAVGLLSVAARAVTIEGSIGFTGTYTQSGGSIGDLTTATAMTITNVGIQPFSATGDLSAAAAPFTFVSPIGVNGNAPSIVGSNLWTVTVGGDVFSFVVTSFSQPFTSSTQLNLSGSGVLSGGTFEDTLGTWQLGFGVSGSSFTWQSTSAANVPDGGLTVMLLGFSLAGLTLMRRRLAA